MTLETPTPASADRTIRVAVVHYISARLAAGRPDESASCEVGVGEQASGGTPAKTRAEKP